MMAENDVRKLSKVLPVVKFFKKSCEKVYNATF